MAHTLYPYSEFTPDSVIDWKVLLETCRDTLETVQKYF